MVIAVMGVSKTYRLAINKLLLTTWIVYGCPESNLKVLLVLL